VIPCYSPAALMLAVHRAKRAPRVCVNSPFGGSFIVCLARLDFSKRLYCISLYE